ncbi:MAG: hypothetical protein ACE5JE_02505 [Thermoplasmata archaeon]
MLGGRVRYALSRLVDFEEPRRLQTDAARQFKERRFHEAFQAARKAVRRIEGESRDYIESGMAVAIASARRILETSEGSTEWARKVSDQLLEVMHAFEGGSFAEAAPLLEKLETAVSRLYAYEMDRHRHHVANLGRAIAEIQAMGGDTTLAHRKLRRAVLALAEDDRESYLEVISEVDELVHRARAKRVEEIEGEAARVKGPLRDGLAQALEAGDLISSHFLLLASRETALPQTSTSSATFQNSQKVTLLKGVLDQIASVIETAEAEGLDVSAAEDDLAAARRLWEKEDYTEALVRGREAYRLLKSLRGQAELQMYEEMEAASPEVGEREFDESEGEEGEEENLIEGDTLLWCLECGSVEVGVDPEGDLRCLRCDAKVPATLPEE